MTAAARSLVVGAAILERGRLLAARRTSPPAAAGHWELPGGKVERGETPEEALVREVAEELGCVVAVTGWLAGVQPIGAAYELRVATARLVSGTPRPVGHGLVRWLTRTTLDDLDWLTPDRPFLPQLAPLLTR
jgi:8-oxo-dGTP diphosphatase